MDDLRNILRSHGVPASEATLIAEMADHAAMQAVESMMRVCDTLPMQYRAHTIMLASVVLRNSLEHFVRDAMQEMRAMEREL